MKRDKAVTLSEDGMVCLSQGRVEEAIACFEQALAAFRGSRDRRGECAALRQLANAAAKSGLVDEASAYLRQAIAVAQELGDQPGHARLLTDLGNMHERLSQLGEARRCWEEALRIFTEINSPYAQQIHGWLANSSLAEASRLIEQGDDPAHSPEDAILYYEQALAICRRIGDKNGEAYALTCIGGALKSIGRRKDAIACFSNALDISREAGDSESEGMALRNLSAVWIDDGNLDAARNCLDQAVALEPEHLVTRARLAQLAFAAGDNSAALEHYEQASSLIKDDPTDFHFDRAMPLLRLGRTDEALGLIRERLDAFDHPGDLEKMLRQYKRWAEREPGIAGLDEAIRLLEARVARAAGGESPA